MRTLILPILLSLAMTASIHAEEKPAPFALVIHGGAGVIRRADIPEENIMIILKQNKPDHLFTYVTHENKFNMPLLLTYIKEKHPGQILNVLTSNKTTLSLNEKTEVINFMCHQQLAQQTLIA